MLLDRKTAERSWRNTSIIYTTLQMIRSRISEAQFPLLADDAERTWQLALNRLKSLQTFRLLTFAESEQRLDELLRMKISEPKEAGEAGALGRTCAAQTLRQRKDWRSIRNAI
jgi:hypothetical protein